MVEQVDPQRGMKIVNIKYILKNYLFLIIFCKFCVVTILLELKDVDSAGGVLYKYTDNL